MAGAWSAGSPGTSGATKSRGATGASEAAGSTLGTSLGAGWTEVGLSVAFELWSRRAGLLGIAFEVFACGLRAFALVGLGAFAIGSRARAAKALGTGLLGFHGLPILGTDRDVQGPKVGESEELFRGSRGGPWIGRRGNCPTDEPSQKYKPRLHGGEDA